MWITMNQSQPNLTNISSNSQTNYENHFFLQNTNEGESKIIIRIFCYIRTLHICKIDDRHARICALLSTVKPMFSFRISFNNKHYFLNTKVSKCLCSKNKIFFLFRDSIRKINTQKLWKEAKLKEKQTASLFVSITSFA